MTSSVSGEGLAPAITEQGPLKYGGQGTSGGGWGASLRSRRLVSGRNGAHGVPRLAWFASTRPPS